MPRVWQCRLRRQLLRASRRAVLSWDLAPLANTIWPWQARGALPAPAARTDGWVDGWTDGASPAWHVEMPGEGAQGRVKMGGLRSNPFCCSLGE